MVERLQYLRLGITKCFIFFSFIEVLFDDFKKGSIFNTAFYISNVCENQNNKVEDYGRISEFGMSENVGEPQYKFGKIGVKNAIIRNLRF